MSEKLAGTLDFNGLIVEKTRKKSFLNIESMIGTRNKLRDFFPAVGVQISNAQIGRECDKYGCVGSPYLSPARSLN